LSTTRCLFVGCRQAVVLQINDSGSHAKLFLRTISEGMTVKSCIPNNSQTRNKVETTLQLNVPAVTLSPHPE
jgi:ribosomal protein L19